MEKRNFSMDDVVSYCNQYGFIFQGSEIYGGLPTLGITVLWERD